LARQSRGRTDGKGKKKRKDVDHEREKTEFGAKNSGKGIAKEKVTRKGRQKEAAKRRQVGWGGEDETKPIFIFLLKAKGAPKKRRRQVLLRKGEKKGREEGSEGITAT